MRTSCSACFSVCIPPLNSRAPALASPPCGASSTGTADGSGRKAPSIRERRSTSLCDDPLPAGLEALVNPGKILLVEDNPDDVALTLRALKSHNITNDVVVAPDGAQALEYLFGPVGGRRADRKSTRLNSSHDQISYAVFCLKKKKKKNKNDKESSDSRAMCR